MPSESIKAFAEIVRKVETKKIRSDEPVYREADPELGKRILSHKTPVSSSISASELMAKKFDRLKQPVEGLISEGLTLFVGASKIGKSWLVLDMCLSVALGIPFLSKKTERGDVLYLALEDSQRRLKSRLASIGLPVSDKLYFSTESPLLGEGLEDSIDTWMQEHQDTSMIVIDTLQKVRSITSRGVNAYQADYKDIGQLKQVASKHRIALVLVHHTNKLRNVTDSFDKISGSSAIMGASDTAILINRERGKDEATVRFAGRDIWGEDFIMRFENCRWTITHPDAEEHFALQRYEDDPLVQIIRKLATENPEGIRIGYEKVKTVGLELLGYSPFIDGRDCAKKLSNGLADELRCRDNILVEIGARASNGNGLRISNVKPKTVFQTKISDKRR